MQMTDEYRAERRDLRQTRRKLRRDCARYERENARQQTRLRCLLERARREALEAEGLINRRLAILEGRLA